MTPSSPSKGKGAPNLFYCRPTNDKSGPCHAPDCDGRSACMLQLKRTQKTKDCREVKHQDYLWCGYCGKRRHYEDECHIKPRESEQLKKAGEEQRVNAGNGTPKEGGQNPWGSQGKGKGDPGGGRRSSAPAPPTFGRGAPNPTPEGEQPGEKRTVPSIPSASGTEKNDNAKKRKLNWHSKCLKAATVEVKFPEEG